MLHLGLAISARNTAASGGGAVDAWTAASPIGDFNPDSIDAAAVAENDPISVWNDAGSAGLNVTGTGDTRPVLHISAGGIRQARFDGLDFLAAVNTTDFEFLPQTDEFSLVVKLGEDVTEGAFKYIVSKAGTTSGTRTYAIFLDTNGYKAYAGGTLTAAFGAPTNAEGDLIIVTYAASATGLNGYVNGVQVLTDGNIGTGQNTAARFNIGARDGSASFTGDIERIAVYDHVLTLEERTNIQTQEGY